MDRPSMSAAAMRAQANRRIRLASYVVAATAVTAVLASASTLTFLLSAIQVVAAVIAVVQLRTGKAPKAVGWLGLALVAGIGSLADSLPSLDAVLLAVDLINVATLLLAWHWTNAASHESRAAYAAEKRAIHDSHQRDRDLDRGFIEKAEKARVANESDELIYIDDLADEPAERSQRA